MGRSFESIQRPSISPELLAALAQAEGAGNPVASTYWRWRLTWSPFAIYRPASSSVGMYQMTDAAFAEARHYCIRDHNVVEDGCSFTGLDSRVIPSRAIELTAVFLDRKVTAILARRLKTAASAAAKAGTRRNNSSLRRKSGKSVRTSRVPSDRRRALRRPGGCGVSCSDQRDETRVPALRRQWLERQPRSRRRNYGGSETRGKELFRGKVVDVARLTTEGFLRGSATIEGSTTTGAAGSNSHSRTNGWWPGETAPRSRCRPI